MRFDVFDFDDDQPQGQISVDDRDGTVDPADIIAALKDAGFLADVDADNIDIEEGDDDDTFDVYDNPDSDEPAYELVATDVIEGHAEVIEG